MPLLLDSPSIEGVDEADAVVHIEVPGRMVAFCGRPWVLGDVFLPEWEVTDDAWCPMCKVASF